MADAESNGLVVDRWGLIQGKFDVDGALVILLYLLLKVVKGTLSQVTDVLIDLVGGFGTCQESDIGVIVGTVVEGELDACLWVGIF